MRKLTDIKALLQAQPTQFTSQLTNLSNQFKNTGNSGRGGNGSSRGGKGGGRGGRGGGAGRGNPTQDQNNLSTQIDKPGVVNKFILGNFHKHINSQP